MEGDFSTVCERLGMAFDHLAPVNVSLQSDHRSRKGAAGTLDHKWLQIREFARRVTKQRPKSDFPVPEFAEALAAKKTTAALQSLYAEDL
jgi:hypothetical protein